MILMMPEVMAMMDSKIVRGEREPVSTREDRIGGSWCSWSCMSEMSGEITSEIPRKRSGVS